MNFDKIQTIDLYTLIYDLEQIIDIYTNANGYKYPCTMLYDNEIVDSDICMALYIADLADAYDESYDRVDNWMYRKNYNPFYEAARQWLGLVGIELPHVL